MGKKNVSLKSIAEELGISVNSVSHALRDFDDISDITKAKVRQKALELGYMPNQVSQRTKLGEKAVVAILVESFDNLYFNSLCKQLFAIFGANNEFDCQIIYLGDDHIDVIKQCVLQRVDLLIAHIEFSLEVLEFAKLQNIQIVKLCNDVSHAKTDIVSIDDKMGCEIAAKYLWEKRASCKFMYVDADCALSEIRYRYFGSTLSSLGAKDIIRYSLTNGDVESLCGYIKDGYQNIFCYNDDTAYHILAALDRAFGDVYSVFPSLHIVGFDGLCDEVVGIRPLTTVKINYKEFASVIYDVVSFRLAHPSEPPRRVLLPVSLHKR